MILLFENAIEKLQGAGFIGRQREESDIELSEKVFLFNLFYASPEVFLLLTKCPVLWIDLENKKQADQDEEAGQHTFPFDMGFRQEDQENNEQSRGEVKKTPCKEGNSRG